jgi:PAS domain S-box-containing protein
VEPGTRTRLSVRLLYLVGIGAWLLLVDFILVGATGHRFPRPLGVVASWIFVGVSTALLAALGGRRLAHNREQARLLHLQQTALQALGALTDPTLSKLPTDQLLDAMLARLLDALGVQTAAVYLLNADGSELVGRASIGTLADARCLRADLGLAGRIIDGRSPLVTWSTVEIEELVPPTAGLVSLAGCPLVIEDRLIGVCLVGSVTPKTFNEADVQLLQLVADRVGAAIEWSRLDEAERRSRIAAEHARQNLTLLARASEVLSTAIDTYEPELAALVDVIVPDFADWCAVDAVEPGGSLRRIAVRHGAEQAPSASLSERFPSIDDLLDRAVQLSATQQVAESPGATAGVIVPIQVRNRTFGVITVATDANRAGYEPADVAVVEQLAARAGLTAERVLLYRELRAREAQWRALVEATPAGIVEVDLDGRILLWNRFAAAMFGWEANGSQPPTFSADTATALSGLWSRAASGEEIVDAQLSANVAGGERRDLAVSVAPLRAATGAIEGILTLAADVTERRRLQEGLQEAQRTEALGQVAGAVAHDFNNLLTVITGYTDLLSRRLILDEDDQRTLDNIRNSAERASMLTGQLLTVSRRQVAKPIVLAPDVTLQTIGEVLQRILGIDIVLEWRLGHGAGNVCIDPGRLEQLVLNLAINARDAMTDGGRLMIGTAGVLLDVDEAVRLGTTPGRSVRITVADTGVGMDERTRERCFEPFFTTKDRSKGTGLGLAAVQGIVEEAGGAIEVDSQLGVGSTFTVYLPSVDEPLTVDVPVPPSPVAGGSETVLVVDDQTDVRQLIRKVLAHEGYQVLEAASGAEAIRIAEHWDGSIELLVTDVMMPGMRGTEVAAGVKALRPSIEVLLISGYTDDTRLPLETATDPLAFLAKPFKPSELANRVREILDHRW